MSAGVPSTMYLMLTLAGLILLFIMGALFASYFLPAGEELQELAFPAVAGASLAMLFLVVLMIAYLARKGDEVIKPLEG
ncbi:MAG: hypothetical protein ABDH61_00655 [Acidilobaceae archaeon]